MPNGPIHSPLRYPGGKSGIASTITNYMNLRLNRNDLTYVEPFSGGAAIALSMVFNNHVQRSIINDLDRSVYSFWHSVLNNTDELNRMINDTPITYDNWLLFKNIHENKNDYGELELGFATFFLNRTNRSGIIKGGVIGGIEQKGNNKIDCRFTKPDLIKRINRIAQDRHRFELYNLDVFDLIELVIQPIRENSFVYYDPPYYKKADGLYENHFSHDDHIALRNAITNHTHNWIMTYDDCPEIRAIYEGYAVSGLELNYSVGTKRKGNELFIWPE